MKKILFLVLIQLFAVSFSMAQGKFFTRTGKISFYSEATLENIEAHNTQSTCILDTDNGEMAFSVLMKGFDFEKALMQEHFNENYVESEKYPKSTFKGKIKDFAKEKFTKDGKYDVVVEGDLTIHGVTQKVSTPGVIEVGGGNIKANATFPVAVSSYKIKIPSAVVDNIAKEVKITVDLELEPYNR